MKSSIILASIAVASIFIFSCGKKSDCSSNNTGSILFHNDPNGFNPDSIHVFTNGTDLGLVRLSGQLQVDNLPVGKGLYTFKYQGSLLYSDSISVTQCNTSHFIINWLPISDKRLKKNILSLNNALANIGKLNIYSFEYNAPKNYAGFLPGGLHYGFMAQELKDVYPTFVQMNSNGYYSVTYQEMIPVLAKGIQEQQTQIDDLKKEVAELKTLMKNQQVVAMK